MYLSVKLDITRYMENDQCILLRKFAHVNENPILS